MERLRNLFLCTTLHCGACTEPPKTICGIGAVLEPNDLGELEVADLIPGGSAEASGLLQIGDILHEVDGLDMYKMPAKEVTSRFSAIFNYCVLVLLSKGPSFANSIGGRVYTGRSWDNNIAWDCKKELQNDGNSVHRNY